MSIGCTTDWCPFAVQFLQGSTVQYSGFPSSVVSAQSIHMVLEIGNVGVSFTGPQVATIGNGSLDLLSTTSLCSTCQASIVPSCCNSGCSVTYCCSLAPCTAIVPCPPVNTACGTSCRTSCGTSCGTSCTTYGCCPANPCSSCCIPSTNTCGSCNSNGCNGCNGCNTCSPCDPCNTYGCNSCSPCDPCNTYGCNTCCTPGCCTENPCISCCGSSGSCDPYGSGGPCGPCGPCGPGQSNPYQCPPYGNTHDPTYNYRYSNPYNFTYPYSSPYNGQSGCGGATYGIAYGRRYSACGGSGGELVPNPIAPPREASLTAIFGGTLNGSVTIALPPLSGQAASPTFLLTSGPFGVANNILRLHYTYGVQGRMPVWSLYGGQLQFGG